MFNRVLHVLDVKVPALLILPVFLCLIAYSGAGSNIGIRHIFFRSTRSVLLSIATSFNEDSLVRLRIFLKSFRSFNTKANVILFVPEERLYDIEELLDVKSLFITFVGFHPHGLIVNHRFKLWNNYLAQHYSQTDWVISADSRDIYFQSDPFSNCRAFREFSNNPGFFMISREDQRYVYTNDANVVACYGKEGESSLRNYNLLNAGFLLGDVKGYQSVIKTLISEMDRIGDFCLDQVILNYLILNNKLKSERIIIEPDSQNCILTLGITYNIFSGIGLWNKNWTFYGVYGYDVPVAAVHMYDRNLDHFRFVQSQFV